MGVERGLGLPSRPAPFLLSQDDSKTENQAFCQARGQEKVTMKINPIGAWKRDLGWGKEGNRWRRERDSNLQMQNKWVPGMKCTVCIVKNYVISSMWPARLTLCVFTIVVLLSTFPSHSSQFQSWRLEGLTQGFHYLFRRQLGPCGSINTSRIKLFISTGIWPASLFQSSRSQ